MKKTISLLLCLLMCVPLLISCTDNGVETGTETGTNTAQNSNTVSSVDAPKLAGIKIAGNDIAEYVIVKPADATESESFAAEELASYIEKASGIQLEIVTETGSAKTISLVKDTTGELGDEGFVIKTEGGKVTITGGKLRGCLYGVYEFLEQYIGWRFLTEEVEYLTTEGTVEIADGIEDKQVPTLEYRYSYWTPYMRSQYAAAQQKQNVVTADAKYGGAYTFTGGMVHTLGQLANGAHSVTSQPCLSDETVYQNVLANVLKMLAANPNAKIISVSQDDNMNHCTCAECQKVALEEGVDVEVEKEDGTVETVREARQSAPLLRFVNRIADAVVDAGYTDVTIGTLAYTYSEAPPSITKARDNVMVQFCFYFNCFGHALNDPNCNETGGQWNYYFDNATRAESVKGWGKICKTLYVWDYATNYDQYPIIFPNFHVLAPNMRFYVENNVKGVFAEGYETAVTSLEFGDLRAYLTAKLMWDPYMTEEEYDNHINEFLKGYYGSAWEDIREYFDFATETVIERGECLHSMGGYPERLFVMKEYVLNEDALEALFDRAIAACTDAGETVQTENIKRLRLGYKFVKLTCNYTANYEFGSEKIRAEWQAEAKALYDAMVELNSYQGISRKFEFHDDAPPVAWTNYNNRTNVGWFDENPY